MTAMEKRIDSDAEKKRVKKAKFCLNKSVEELEDFLFGDITTTTTVSDFGAKQQSEKPSFTRDISDTTEDVSTRTSENINNDIVNVDDQMLFFVDTDAKVSVAEKPVKMEDISTDSKEDANIERAKVIEASLWHDEDDDIINVVDESRLRRLRREEHEESLDSRLYEQRLREEFERLHPKPKWAEESLDEETEQTGFDRFKTVGRIISKRTQQLRPDKIHITRLRDANCKEHSESIVSSINWHPNGSVLLTAGLDKTLRLFHIDGRENEKLQSVFFKDLQIRQANFMANGEEVVLTGGKPYYYTYNVETGSTSRIPFIRGCEDEKSLRLFATSPCGKFLAFAGRSGNVMLVSVKDKQYLGSVQMSSGSVTSIQFSSDSQSLFVSSSLADGEIYEWCMRTRECKRIIKDQGSIGIMQMAISRDEKYMATGSQSGIVNLYEMPTDCSSTRPRLIKEIQNLTTEIEQIRFSPDSQLMAISSRVKKDQMRLVHLPSGRVYSNWPLPDKAPLGYVQTFDFAPNCNATSSSSSNNNYSTYNLCLGNDKGKALLFNISP